VAPYAHGNAVFTSKADGTVYALVLQDEGRPAPGSVELPASLVPAGARIDLLGAAGRLTPVKAGETARVVLSRSQQARVAGREAFVLRIAGGR
jgi:hypothetical protein